MAGQLFDEVIPYTSRIAILPADTTALKQLFGGTPTGVRIDAVLVTNTDTIAHVVDLWITNGGVNYGIGSVSVPAGEGYTGTRSVNVLTESLPTDWPALWLDNTSVLSASVEVAVQTGKAVHCTTMGGVT